MEISKKVRDTVVACDPREGPLFDNPTHQMLYHDIVKMLFTSFARCLQQLAFNGCEEAMDNDETSVSQLIGSPSGYKNKTNKHQGPVSSHVIIVFRRYFSFHMHYTMKAMKFLIRHGSNAS